MNEPTTDNTKELIKRLKTLFDNDRPEDRLERLLSTMATLEAEEHDPTFDEALSDVLATPAGLALYEKMLRYRVRHL